MPPSAAPEWLRTGWIFESERDVGARVERLDRRAHARAAGPDDEDVVLGLHRQGRYRSVPLLCGGTSRLPRRALRVTSP